MKEVIQIVASLRKLVLALVCIGLVVATGCTTQPRPVAITDDLGRRVKLESIPQRIVSLAPSNTEILFALDLGNRVVAVTDMCDYPEEAKTKPQLSGFEPSIEFIVGLNPDLVLAIGEYPELIFKLERVGLTVVALQPKGIDGILADIELIGRITRTETKAQSLTANLRERIEAVTSRTETVSSRPRVFYVVGVDPDPSSPWVAGPGSFIDELITLAGGQNIAHEALAPWVQLSMEYILSADPEVIIVANGKHGLSIEKVSRMPGYESMTAVKKGAVYEVDSDPGTRPGPRIAHGLEEMARVIHPELFK